MCACLCVCVEMDAVNRVQIINKAVCISHCANNLRKGMLLTINCPTMDK